jgi:prevent-host-death family protein
MKNVTAADANRHFSKLLREVQAGEEVTITSHGQPVAKVVPIKQMSDEERSAAFDRLIKRLKSQPALNLPKVTRDQIYEDI